MPAQTDVELVADIVDAARTTGARLASTFSTYARPIDRPRIVDAVVGNEDAVTDELRSALSALRPDARFVSADEETTELPRGEWWAVDAVEGNVNHVHGLPEWSVNVTFLRDNVPVVAVVHQPVGDRTSVAAHGRGATIDGVALRASAKSDLDAAIATTGQAEAGQTHTYRRLGDSITAMLSNVLVVRASVPSTFPLLLTASGQNDVFWQDAPTLSGVVAGVLIAIEAGAIATSIDGTPWAPGQDDLLVAAPGVHDAARRVLSPIFHATDPIDPGDAVTPSTTQENPR